MLSASLATGCLRVEVTRHADPRPAFQEAKREALLYQGHRGPASELNVVAWNASDRTLVQARVPMWLVRKLAQQADVDRQDDQRADAEDPQDDPLARRLSSRVRLQDLDRVGLGLLFELEEDQGERVLVWLR